MKKYLLIAILGIIFFTCSVQAVEQENIANESGTYKVSKKMLFHNDKIYIITDGEKYGLAYPWGTLILPIEYTRIKEIPLNSQDILTEKNGLFGVVTKEGKVIVPNEYYYIDSAGKDTFVAQNKKYKFGIIDRENKIVVPFEFDKEKNLLIGDIKFENKNGLFFYNRNSKQLNKMDYDDINWLSSRDNNYFLVEKDGKFGVYDADLNKIIIPVIFDKISTLSSENFLYIVEKNGKKGIYNRDKKLLDLKNKDIKRVETFFIIVIDENDKYSLLNRINLHILEKDAEYIHEKMLRDGPGEFYCIVKKGGKFGIDKVNFQTNITENTVNFDYDNITEFVTYGYTNKEKYYYDKYIIAVKNGKMGLVNIDTGKIKVDFIFDEMSHFHNNEFKVTQNGKTKIYTIEAEKISKSDKVADGIKKTGKVLISPIRFGLAVVAIPIEIPFLYVAIKQMAEGGPKPEYKPAYIKINEEKQDKNFDK